MSIWKTGKFRRGPGNRRYAHPCRCPAGAGRPSFGLSSSIGLIALSRREMRRITIPETDGPESNANGGG